MPEMMMMIKKLKSRHALGSRFFILLLLSVFGFQPLDAQQKDFQAWPSLQINLEVLNNFKFHLEEEVRFNENLSLVSRQVNDFGASYRLNRYLKAGIFYRLEADWKNADEYVWRNGLYSDLSARTELERFTVSYRLRIQSSKVERHSDESELLNGFRHRHKISVEYDVKGIPLVPFIDGELFIDYSAQNRSKIKGFRTWAGLDYTINRMHTVSIKYGIDQELNSVDPLRSYIIALGYTLDISLELVK